MTSLTEDQLICPPKEARQLRLDACTHVQALLAGLAVIVCFLGRRTHTIPVAATLIMLSVVAAISGAGCGCAGSRKASGNASNTRANSSS